MSPTTPLYPHVTILCERKDTALTLFKHHIVSVKIRPASSARYFVDIKTSTLDTCTLTFTAKFLKEKYDGLSIEDVVKDYITGPAVYVRQEVHCYNLER